MPNTDLTEVVNRLRAFERAAREISADITPLLAKGLHTAMTPMPHGCFATDVVDARLPLDVAGQLHRIQVQLGDAIHVIGGATFALTAAVASHPELQSAAPSPPDIDQEPVETVAERPKPARGRRG